MARFTLALTLFLAVVPTSGQTTPSRSAPDRSTALHTLFRDVWEDNLKRSPEFASALGERRYNDQLSDLSARAFNERIAAHRMFLDRLLVIDTAGLSQQDRASADLLQREFLDDEESAATKPWELPINEFRKPAARLPAQLAFAPFETVKDFDDYIARLHLVPTFIRQLSEALLAGIDDHRVQPAAMIQQSIVLIDAIVAKSPADSVFAEPIGDFPASIDSAQEKRLTAAVLDAIETDVLPAYARFAKFLRSAELPAADPNQTNPQPYHQSGDQLRQTEVIALLIKSQAALGDKFDLKAFSELIAANSTLPLDMLQMRVNAWITSQSAVQK